MSFRIAAYLWTIRRYNRTTGDLIDEPIDLGSDPLTNSYTNGPRAIYIYNNELYVLNAVASTNCRVYNLTTHTLARTFDLPGISRTTSTQFIAVTPDYIYTTVTKTVGTPNPLVAHTHTGTRVPSADIPMPRVSISGPGGTLTNRGWTIRGLYIDNYIYVLAAGLHNGSGINNTNYGSYQRILVFSLTGNEISRLQVQLPNNNNDWGALQVYQGLYYIWTRRSATQGRITYTARYYYAFTALDSLNYQAFLGYQFDTHDFDSIYLLTTNTIHGDLLTDRIFNQNRVSKYVRSTNTWSTILNTSIGQPQLGVPYDFMSESRIVADNRKNFQVHSHNSKTLIFYRRVQSSTAGVAYYNETDNTITDVYSETFGTNDGLPYSMDFVLDVRSDGIYVYSFIVKYTFLRNNFQSATLKVYRRRVEPLGTQSEIFTETFTGTSGDDLYPVSVSDLILADDRSKWYFTLDYQSEADAPGKAELCELPKDGGTRVVRKTYTNPLLGPRSPARVGSRYFYLEGGWVRLPKSDPSDDTLPDDERHYPNEGGHLIEIESNGDITDHGIVWRSRSKLDSPDPDPENPQYDGYGRHNAITTNMVVDKRGNLRFVAGYGLPYRINNNLPTAEITGAIPDETNFNWIQFGQDLSTKIASFPTSGRRGWELIQQLAQLMNWEIGFSPAMSKVDALQAAHSSISDWSANASFFFRPRTILPAKLRTSITASGIPSTIEINDSGLPAEISEFPVPPSGKRYAVIVDKEMFTYTGVTEDTNGRILSGIQRAQHGSTAAAHSVDAAVYFVDYFASGEQGTTLVSIQNRSLDFVNLKNDINVGFGDTVYNAKDQGSIDANGEKTFNLGTSQPLLSRQDQAWAQLIGDIYLNELKDIKEVLQFTLVFSPQLQPGQLVVLYQMDRVRIEFKLFRLLQVHHHTFPRWQTQVTALEIIP